MISLTVLLFSAALGTLVYFAFLKAKKNKNYPHGPPGLPVIGNSLQLAENAHLTLQKWAKIYGDIYKVKQGWDTAYVISDLKTLKEVLNDPNHSGRPVFEFLEEFRYGPHGIAVSSGPEWVEQRRFSLRHLRDFGFGKSAGEEIIMNEVHELLSLLTKQAGHPCKLDRAFHVAVLNTLWMITTGNRYQHDDPRVWTCFNYFEKVLVKVGKNPTALFFPTLAKLFPNFSGWDWLLKMREEMTSIVQGHIEQHKEAFPEDGVPRDFMDAYLAEIKRTTDANSSFHKSVATRSLMATMIDFFLGGSDTVSTTVLWGILYLCKYPEVQKKLQDELDSVVGRNRHPALSDRISMPYFEATFAEIMRFSSLVPTSLNHGTERDCKILGYDCPKGTVIIANIYAIHYNEKYFPEPYQFKPERFLCDDGKTFKKPEAVLGFGYGKRVCLGETLARDEFFLYFANVFHRFNIRLADESRDVSLEGVTKFFRYPHEYKVVVTVRD